MLTNDVKVSISDISDIYSKGCLQTLARRISLIGACPSPRPFAIGFTAGLDGEQIASLTLAVEGITTGIFRQSTVAALAPIRVGGVGLRIARTLERWLSRNDDYGMSGLGAEVC